MRALNRTKYNVEKNRAKRTLEIDGKEIVFDSELEKRYLLEVVLPGVQSGEIVSYELQHKYELQPAYIDRDGKKVRPIVYVSDFELYMADGTHITVDVKGMLKPIDMLKHKILLHRYPELDFRLIGYSKIDGGWVPLETIQQGRKARKRAKMTP